MNAPRARRTGRPVSTAAPPPVASAMPAAGPRDAAELIGAVAKATLTKPTAAGPAIADQVGYALADVLAKQLADMLTEVLPAAVTKTISDDVLAGAEPLAGFLGMNPRQVYHLASTGKLPVFRIGTLICARKSTLLRWIADQETQRGGGTGA